ncbi:hypothetical protein [Alterisphingorhabdus coralli]|uniref:Uncharacterized protein n=1 Tax=Alterisphingorhabdus coralli TaxID=3071408 RepID=A0AA97FA15_9SPHN|nr:hypothetical protein [Parasphingorhabdus sp. SCSIO 66989]WOE76738.1 hypothetical protein RB602_15240 [Parasphingorhabdus sp. SCSIO 66989]
MNASKSTPCITETEFSETYQNTKQIQKVEVIENAAGQWHIFVWVGKQKYILCAAKPQKTKDFRSVYGAANRLLVHLRFKEPFMLRPHNRLPSP